MPNIGRLTVASMMLMLVVILAGTTRAGSETKSTRQVQRTAQRPSMWKSWKNKTQSYFAKQKSYVEYVRGGTAPF